MLRAVDIDLQKSYGFRLVGGSILVEYRTKVVYRHEIVGGVAVTTKRSLTSAGAVLKIILLGRLRLPFAG